MAGKSISELSTLGSTHLKGDDLFVFSQKRTGSDLYDSKSVSYQKLSSELSIALSGVLGKDHHVYLTKAEYNALTPAQRNDEHTVWCITDDADNDFVIDKTSFTTTDDKHVPSSKLVKNSIANMQVTTNMDNTSTELSNDDTRYPSSKLVKKAIDDAKTTGKAGTITIGKVETGAPGSSASVTNIGTSEDAILDFVIPAGANGTNGTNGTAATIKIGEVTQLPFGQNPTVTNSGSLTEAVFDFGIPAGAKGDPGTAGESVLELVADVSSQNGSRTVLYKFQPIENGSIVYFLAAKYVKGDSTYNEKTIYPFGSGKKIGMLQNPPVTDAGMTQNQDSILIWAGKKTTGGTTYTNEQGGGMFVVVQAD